MHPKAQPQPARRVDHGKGRGGGLGFCGRQLARLLEVGGGSDGRSCRCVSQDDLDFGANALDSDSEGEPDVKDEVKEEKGKNPVLINHLVRKKYRKFQKKPISPYSLSCIIMVQCIVKLLIMTRPNT